MNKKIFCAFSLFLTLGLHTLLAQAQILSSWLDTARIGANKIIDEGKTDVYWAGYTYHGRSTYTAQRISELNEKTWGLGMGKSRRDKDGDEHSLFLMGISDSHYKPQLMGGYIFQYKWNIGAGIETGLGYSALLISRTDMFSSIPFPAILPVASIGSKNFSVMTTYVPRLSANKGNGDVLFIFGKITLD